MNPEYEMPKFFHAKRHKSAEGVKFEIDGALVANKKSYLTEVPPDGFTPCNGSDIINPKVHIPLEGKLTEQRVSDLYNGYMAGRNRERHRARVEMRDQIRDFIGIKE